MSQQSHTIALPTSSRRPAAPGALVRREPQLLPAYPAQQRHLAAARRLDVGPKPPAGRGVIGRLSGLMDVAAFAVLQRLFSGAHRGELGQADYYEMEGGWLARSEHADDDVSPYYPEPAAPRMRRRRRAGLPGGWVEDLEFDSTPAPQRPTAVRMLRRYPRNRVAVIRRLCHADGGRPALVWIHGWGMGHHRIEAAVCKARWLYELGLDVYLYVQPYHGKRRPDGVLFAGRLYPSTHMTRTNEGVLQSVWELRALMAWHRQQGGAECGVVGLSLGAYIAAVLASVAPELAFAVPLLPVADMPTLMWSNGEGTADRRQAEQAGVTFEMFCRSMAVHAPLARELCIPRDRVLLVGAEADRIIPPEHTRVLWEHWGRPRIHWIHGGHLVHFGREGYLCRLHDLLRDLRLL